MAHFSKGTASLTVFLAVVLLVCVSVVSSASVNVASLAKEVEGSGSKASVDAASAASADTGAKTDKSTAEDQQKLPLITNNQSNLNESRKPSEVLKTEGISANSSALPLNSTKSLLLNKETDLIAEESQVRADSVSPVNALTNSNPVREVQNVRGVEEIPKAPVSEANSTNVDQETGNGVSQNGTVAAVSKSSASNSTNPPLDSEPVNSVDDDVDADEAPTGVAEAPIVVVNTNPPDLSAYKYLVKANVCPKTPEGESPQIVGLLMITSLVGNEDQRNAIRKMYPKEEIKLLGLYRVFILANDQTDGSEKKINLVEENEKYSDIVQFNTNETYSDLPKTILLAMKYAVLNCRDANFFVKAEENALLNHYGVAEELQALEETGKDKLCGHIWSAMHPIRPDSGAGVDPKYFTTVEEFPGDVYPTYLSGLFYAFSYKTAKKLLKASAKEPYFKTEDVYVTGMLAQAAGIEHLNMEGKFTFEPNTLSCCFNEKEKIVHECNYIVGFKYGSDAQIAEAMLRTKTQNEYCYVNQNCTAAPERGFLSKDIICS